MQQLKLFRAIDSKGGNVFAIAPNGDIAALAFINQLQIPPNVIRLVSTSDGMADLPNLICNLLRLLQFRPIGVAIFGSNESAW